MDFIYIEIPIEETPPEPQPTFKPETVDCTGLVVLPVYVAYYLVQVLIYLVQALACLVATIPTTFQSIVDFVTPILYPQDIEEKKHGPDSSTSLWKGL